MGEVRSTLWCNRCQRNTAHIRQAPNHVLHFLITFFTCGFWAIAWIALTIASSASDPAHCQVCGTAYAEPRKREPEIEFLDAD